MKTIKFSEIETKLAKIAKGKYHSFSVTRTTHSRKTGETILFEFRLYIDGYGAAIGEDLNSCFKEMRAKVYGRKAQNIEIEI